MNINFNKFWLSLFLAILGYFSIFRIIFLILNRWNKNIPDYALVVGNPSKQIGWVCDCGKKLNKSYNCINCSKKYEIYKSGLKEINE